MSSAPTRVACPTCGNSVEWVPESEWRPFCSERCKIIDLGAWASEKYRVPITEDSDEPESDGPPIEPPVPKAAK